MYVCIYAKNTHIDKTSQLQMDLTQSTVMILMTRRNRCILCFFMFHTLRYLSHPLQIRLATAIPALQPQQGCGFGIHCGGPQRVMGNPGRSAEPQQGHDSVPKVFLCCHDLVGSFSLCCQVAHWSFSFPVPGKMVIILGQV